MDTQILKIASIFENPDELQQAADILARGGLVAFPTETVYGLGANGLDEEAVRSIYQAKGRPSDNPLILHICDTEMLPQLAREIPKAALKLALEFWPGPLTMVLPKTEQVPDVVSGGLDTVAIRFPSNLIARELIRRSGKPIAAPSANLSCSPSPTTAQHCIDDLMGRVDAIVDGGSCGVGLESTVISLAGEIPTVLRPGGVTVEQLRRVLSEVRVDPAVTHPMAAGQKAASPGMKYKHYAPKAKVVLVNGNTESFAATSEKATVSSPCVFQRIFPFWKCLQSATAAKSTRKSRLMRCLMRCAGWMIKKRSWYLLTVPARMALDWRYIIGFCGQRLLMW